MMAFTFEEWADKYGIESARKQFGLTDHLVLVVREGSNVFGICGNWRANEPLDDKRRNPNVETAKQRLRDALRGCYETEETITE